jgi:AcrR family transcriptional regulator
MNLLDVKKSSTRTRVLVTAKILFAQKGYSACSMRQLATRAKVNEVTVFRLFGTKQKLYGEVLLQAAECSKVDALRDSTSLDRSLRNVARQFGDPLFVRLFLFGILEQPEITMKQLHTPLQNLSAHVSARLKSSDFSSFHLKDMEAFANMIEALALFHQCAGKLVNGKSGRKQSPTTVLAHQIRESWLFGTITRKNGITVNS